MNQIRNLGGPAFRRLVLASFVIWSLLPSFNHAPQVLGTLQEHAKIVEKHGHSHGFIEDLMWAMHGHDHDEIDHDHSPVMLSSASNDFYLYDHENLQQPALSLANSPNFLIKRPPRV